MPYAPYSIFSGHQKISPNPQDFLRVWKEEHKALGQHSKPSTPPPPSLVISVYTCVVQHDSHQLHVAIYTAMGQNEMKWKIQFLSCTGLVSSQGLNIHLGLAAVTSGSTDAELSQCSRKFSWTALSIVQCLPPCPCSMWPLFRVLI